MKKISVLIVTFLCTTIGAFAQLRKLEDVEAFNNRLQKELSSLTSIESDFKQTKRMAVFNSEVVSTGKFYYQKEQKVRFEYTSPVVYVMVMNGTKLKTITNGQKSVIDLSSNQMMGSVQQMISACMLGDLASVKSSYSIVYQEDNVSYVVTLTPKNSIMKEYIQQIMIAIDKKDMSVSRLKLVENSDNYTEFEFRNKKANATISVDKFSIR